jgi:hypothetical protein
MPPEILLGARPHRPALMATEECLHIQLKWQPLSTRGRSGLLFQFIVEMARQ